jgi:AcrR family transcriptional regulator
MMYGKAGLVSKSMTGPNNQTYQRILEVAEALFSTRGYASVRLRDIASAIDVNTPRCITMLQAARNNYLWT